MKPASRGWSPIGDLVSTTPLFDESRVKDGDTAVELFRDLARRRGSADQRRCMRRPVVPGRGLRPFVALRSRADVAKTIYYRRRKGTLPMLEELARDVTGWPAHAVEYFELLGWTQWVRNHLRFHSPRTPDIRSVERMDRLTGAFDEIAHTVDVRPIAQDEGWYNVRNIGFHLWRLNAYALDRTEARQLGGAGDFRYFFNPLGNSAPLFSRARREGDDAGLATELHVPQPVRPARFFAGIADFYGSLPNQSSITVFVDGIEIPAAQVVCRNLSVWSQPSTDRIAIDVVRGRLTLGPALVPANRVEVTYHNGFPADLGGRALSLRAWLIRPNFALMCMCRSGARRTSDDRGTIGEWQEQRSTAATPSSVSSIAEPIRKRSASVHYGFGTTLAVGGRQCVRICGSPRRDSRRSTGLCGNARRVADRRPRGHRRFAASAATAAFDTGTRRVNRRNRSTFAAAPT